MHTFQYGKKFMLLLLMLVLSLPAMAQMEKGSKSLGVKAGYVTLNRSASMGLQLEYAFSRHFLLAPGIDFVFRNRNLDGMLINLDYHGPWNLDKSGRWNVYHILGVNFASWSKHTPARPGGDTVMRAADDNDDVTTRTSKIGLDFGLGFSYYVKPTLKLSVEGKFNWLEHHNTGLFYVGIAYVF